MIDFNNSVEKLNKFPGSEKKTTVIYKNEIYMIKFPDPIREKNNNLSYMNNQFSEHIGCRIFSICGFEVQETILGYYRDKKGQKKLVVGCKDFTQDGSILYEASKLANSIVEVNQRLDATIENVHTIIDMCSLIYNKNEIKNRFWDMFVIDALIGNSDRHLDNWGVLEHDNEIRFAPIYDCGSSLGALFDDTRMEILLKNFTLFKNEEFNAKSCYTYKSKRIFYHEIFKNPPEELQKAVDRTMLKIDMERIADIISTTEEITDIRKEYLIKAIDIRYNQIIHPAYKN